MFWTLKFEFFPKIGQKATLRKCPILSDNHYNLSLSQKDLYSYIAPLFGLHGDLLLMLILVQDQGRLNF